MSGDSSNPELIIDAAFKKYDTFLVNSSSEDEESQFGRWENSEILSYLPFNFVDFEDFTEDSIHILYLPKELPFYYCDGPIDFSPNTSGLDDIFSGCPNSGSSDIMQSGNSIFYPESP